MSAVVKRGIKSSTNRDPLRCDNVLVSIGRYEFEVSPYRICGLATEIATGALVAGEAANALWNAAPGAYESFDEAWAAKLAAIRGARK